MPLQNRLQKVTWTNHRVTPVVRKDGDRMGSQINNQRSRFTFSVNDSPMKCRICEIKAEIKAKKVLELYLRLCSRGHS